MEEIWKPVVGYEGRYEVSNLGNVKSLFWRGHKGEKNLYLKPSNGYRQVQLYKNGHYRMIKVHRLVALAFIPNPDNLPQINHIDYDRANNNVENLEWCTADYNCKHSWENPERKVRCQFKPCLTMDRKNKKIVQETKDYVFVREWEKCFDIRNELGFHHTSIWECCEGKRKTAYGYIWRYAN